MHDAKKRAQQHFDAAHHFLHNTYPLLKDPKLLLGIFSNISKSLEASMEAILLHGRANHYIPAFGDNFTHKWHAFSKYAVPKHHIAGEFTTMVMDLNRIRDLHDKSPVEFPRGEKLVICNEEYDITTLSAKEAHLSLNKARELLEKTEEILKS
ncbi:hypothetical protein HOD05_02120 [Candidatus Woesearchaeota archaeon]|jgi:hypothetical protein|nr:hypothetical protein [Candidatus Woesearchaeota archaeon]MBT4151249.1 hypothetical protein [Candidatus Woesearchaeota archaeon]MBT4247278.1 hypothetical protein [Candidatus Woesearchaeota archaeon]MBT4433991.1 hypothetical protein [Candidatus Woesearchaeota archaeon]